MEKEDQIKLLLDSLKVLDLTDKKGYFCSKVLGDLGAEVTRLEKAGLKKDYWWWAYNYQKKILNLDIEKEREQVVRLAQKADFLIESFAPGYLDDLGLGYSTLKKVNPRLILVSISPFGKDGPYRDLKASDLELVALSGMMYEMGDAGRPPVRISFPQAYLIASAEAAVGAMMALFWREVYGEGQWVDVSTQASVLSTLVGEINKVKYGKAKQQQMGGNHGTIEGIQMGGGEDKYHHAFNPVIWGCKDGCIAFLMHAGTRGARNNSILMKYIEADGDVPEKVRNLKWETFDFGQTSPEEVGQIRNTFSRFFKRHTRQELSQIALRERIELFPANTVKEVLEDGQLDDRRFWQMQNIPGLGKDLKYPGPLAKLRPGPTAAGAGNKTVPSVTRRPPFAGVKVLDFSWVYTGPWITQWLAINGAEVVKIESMEHLDATRRNKKGYAFAGFNTGKKDVTINLKHPEGKELIYKLTKWADIVVENFSPGTMQRLGFGYDELLKLNPRIIMLSASMFGSDGRHAAQRGLGFQLTALAGFNDLTGWPDRNPVLSRGAYTDVLACRIGAATLFAALDYQKRSGSGGYIDLSQYEASMHFLTPLILEYQVTGKLMTRMGNRSLTDSPHAVFRCRGEGRWCALSVSSDAEWQAFCRATGHPEWIDDPEFATFASRKQHEDKLEGLVAGWTEKLSAEEVMDRLQKAGVKAGLVEDMNDLSRDPQLSYRKVFTTVMHPEFGPYDYSGPGFILEKGDMIFEAAPRFGEHNRYVCTEILGLSDDEYQHLVSAKALE